jgi:hypothetical protein
MFVLLSLAVAAAATPECTTSTALTAQEGRFTDGSKTEDDYATNQDHCWAIKPECPAESLVTLSFERMAVEREYDFVQVYSAGGELLSKAADTSETFTAEGFTVWFHSDDSVTDQGFTASYSCETLDEAGDETISVEEAYTSSDQAARFYAAWGEYFSL